MPADTGSRRLRPTRLFGEWLAVGTVLGILVTGLILAGGLRRFDHLLYDLVITARPRPPPDAIVIIGIDEASLARIGPWPWPRRIHADAIARLAAARPRAIGYDVLFTEAGPDDAGLDDARLDDALRASPVPVVLPLQFMVPGRDGRAHDDVPPVVGRGAGSAARVGQSTIVPDEDGVVRTLAMAVDGTTRWPQVAALLAGADVPVPFRARPATAPLRRVDERLVGFRGPPGSFRTLSFAALLDGEIPPELLRDRIVMIGATAAGLGDQFSTPTAGRSGVMAGVEIEASLVADLLEGRRLRRAGDGAAIALALAVLGLGMAGLLRLRPAAAAIAGAVLVAVVVLGTALLFAATGLWVAPAGALVGVLLAQPFWAWRRLAAVNDWMMAELAELGGGSVPRAGRSVAADPVTRTTQLLAATIDRVDELREIADAAIRGLPDPTLLVARDGSIAAANTAAAALFGAPGLAAVDRTFAGLPPFGAATLADPATPWRGEHRAADGSIRDIRSTPWRGPDGTALGWIVRFADISALRRAEAAREEALQLLTHDMRAPQASILALLDRNPDLPPALARRLRHLATRTIALADGYLQLARAEAGDHVMAEVDLAAITIEAIDELWPQSQARALRIDGSGLDSEAVLRGNHQLLLRAIVNMIGNAVKFAPLGSTVTCRLAPDGDDWRLDIVDTGPGIAADVQARLFGRFRAGPEADGVGLGLAFVRSVATSHGGSIDVVSAPGAGATFILRVPRLAAAPAPGRPARAG
ncbi:CHASE2 domain-containing protein [Sandarakinorhabdus sp. DWP1-3-1]|uniref:CHASE2 domain-containing protein n=1 Tax=Sandarakinorhabdus sp. DWP1-3-1 TaxID=2804627 RepID=UPI003CE6A212